MLPVEILISEHRLIIHTVGVLKKEQQKIADCGNVDPNFVLNAVDFFRTYADRYHHGKEEGILFRELYKRKLSEADGKMLNDLILEHATARRTVTNLENLKNSYVDGNTEALGGIIDALNTLIELYPRHIEKEDQHFFYPAMQYFNASEQQEMLQEFQQYDQNFTDNHYKQIIDALEEDL